KKKNFLKKKINVPTGNLKALPGTNLVLKPFPSSKNVGRLLLGLKPTLMLIRAWDSCTFAHSQNDSERAI
ncbi:hypothetical protein, partial [Acinetobacter ursingii]|uniref:hypothetical protein n=1 Tax=Acinetobacter ursingii TaxID=108980 RepID=UPI001BC87E54